MSPRGKVGTFVGYAKDCKAYRILLNGAIKISRDVVFDESRMGSADADQSSNPFTGMEDLTTDDGASHADDSLAPVRTSTHTPAADAAEAGDSPAAVGAGTPTTNDADCPPPPIAPAGGTLLDAAELAAQLPPPSPTPEAAGPRRSLRVSFLPRRLGDPGRHGDAGGGGAALAVRAPVDITSAARGAEATHPGSQEGAAYAAYERPNPDKMTLAQARREPDWPAFDTAVRAEMEALWDNGTFELVELPAGAAVLPFQILCERKRGPSGEVARHKGRGVACGNHQVYGRDFSEVWAPVVRRATLLCLLSYAAAEGMGMYQLDVETAFLNGPVDEELYVRLPKGYERGRSGQVLRLRKALYGLRQAARQWYLELVKLMDRMGMRQCVADPCLFMRDEAGGRVYLLVYVDDILLIAKSAERISAMKAQVMGAFRSRDIGKPVFFLGLHLDHDALSGHLLVSQRQYVHRLAERYGLAEAKPLHVPMAPGTVMQKAGEPLPQDGVERYQALVGALLYVATCTRPDVSFAVGRLARYGAAPTVQHEAAALRVLRYLRGTAARGLRFGPRAPLVGYCDADYAGDVDTRRSTSGYVFVLNGAAVSWASKVQPTVAVSTTEAEYIAAATAAREAVWLRQLLLDATGEGGPVNLMSDNQSAIHLMHNPGGTARSMHIDVAHHFVRDRVARGDLVVRYISTTEMAADAMTKALPRQLLGGCCVTFGMAGGQDDEGSGERPAGSVGRDAPEDGGHPARSLAPTAGPSAAGDGEAPGHGAGDVTQLDEADSNRLRGHVTRGHVIGLDGTTAGAVGAWSNSAPRAVRGAAPGPTALAA